MPFPFIICSKALHIVIFEVELTVIFRIINLLQIFSQLNFFLQYCIKVVRLILAALSINGLRGTRPAVRHALLLC